MSGCVTKYLALAIFFSGNPSLSTTADLVINVVDVDDNCPVFQPKEYNKTIEENVAFDTQILRVFATDVDTVGQRLEYGIRSASPDGSFTIERYQGE